ncbi:MAG: RsbRD N-terminal domain-containing protein [Deltaproteobacteria bacterium]|nr:RsbRD N-terminal domain-containing protein [Deltaproteobacteria bacterium]
MKLEKLLLKNKSNILKRWLDSILESYSSDTIRFLKKQSDQFANPVGQTISTETANLFQELLEGIDPARISPILDRIIRIRAVQDFSPSQAIFFVFQLKGVIQKELNKEIRKERLSDELAEFESRIDDMALIAFDVYMRCREKIYEISANQTKNQVSRLLQRTGLISEVPEWEPNKNEET